MASVSAERAAAFGGSLAEGEREDAGQQPPGGDQPGRQRAEVDLLQRAGLDLAQQPPEHLGDLQVGEQERDHPHDQDRHPAAVQRPAQLAAGDLVAGAEQRAELQRDADEQRELDEDLDPLGPGVQQPFADLVADDADRRHDWGGHAGHAARPAWTSRRKTSSRSGSTWRTDSSGRPSDCTSASSLNRSSASAVGSVIRVAPSSAATLTSPGRQAGPSWSGGPATLTS